MSAVPGYVKRQRQIESRNFRDRCTLKEPGPGIRTPSGGTTLGTPVTTENVRCSLGPVGSLSPSEQVIVGKLTLKQPALICFDWDRAVSEQASMTFPDGRVFEAKGEIPQGNMRVLTKIICERVK